MALRAHLGAALALALTLAVGCTPSPDRLSSPARNFYYVIEDGSQQTEYLKLKESERQDFLEKLGLWQQWTELSPEERDAALSGDIKVGYKEFTAHMAWGLPADVRMAEARGRSVAYQTFIRCTSGPKKGQHVRQNLECDGTSSETQVTIDGGVVVEIVYPN